MNTEAIYKKFKVWCNTDAATKVRNMFMRGDDKNAHSALFRAGYQQAVKDMEAVISALNDVDSLVESSYGVIFDDGQDIEWKELFAGGSLEEWLGKYSVTVEKFIKQVSDHE